MSIDGLIAQAKKWRRFHGEGEAVELIEAFISESARLQAELAEARKERDSFERLWKRTDADATQEADGLIEDRLDIQQKLAEARAVIEQVRMANVENSIATRGADEWVDPNGRRASLRALGIG